MIKALGLDLSCKDTAQSWLFPLFPLFPVKSGLEDYPLFGG